MNESSERGGPGPWQWQGSRRFKRTWRDARGAAVRIRESFAVPIGFLATVVTAALIAALMVAPPPPRALPKARAAPDFSLPTDLNDTVSLSGLRGSVVIIHFVILACCARSALEIGYMEQIEPTVRDLGVVFVSIAVNSEYNYYSPQEYREVMRFDWTLALDFDGAVQGLYNAVETSTFVVDRQGMIRYHDDETTSSATLSDWLARVM